MADMREVDAALAEAKSPYVRPLGERETPAIPGGWPLALALAVAVAAFAVAMRWRERRKIALKAARQLAVHLRGLGNPLDPRERRLLNKSMRRLSASARIRLFSDPEAMRRHLAAANPDNDEVWHEIGRKLEASRPERTEGLPVGTRLNISVDGFPGHFEGTVKSVTENALSIDLLPLSGAGVHFQPGDLFRATLLGSEPEREFRSRVRECVVNGEIPHCRLSHGEIIVHRPADNPE